MPNRAQRKPSRALKAGKTEMIKGTRKKPRARPGTKALREIASEQKNSHKKFAIPSAPFERLAREVASEYIDDIRFSARSIEALQAATEAHLISMFEGAKNSHCKNGRITTMQRDIHEEAQKMGILPPPMPWKEAAQALAARKEYLAQERKAADARRQARVLQAAKDAAAAAKKKPKGMRQSTGKDPKPLPEEEEAGSSSDDDESSGDSSGEASSSE